ncbi:MAG: class I SAM-dependent methyltransferase [Candidatus Pacebacteria bacterium]|nr:class I SAM-dependent methyltransferase [Candidatus Paceibacterota bacterium]
MTSTPTTCPICTASSTFSTLERYVDPQTVTSYTLFECSACSVRFWEPLKNPGGDWYAHDGRYADRNELPILAPNWNHTKIISFLSPFTGKVLDVGCGVGTFLAWASLQGWQSTGIDFDADAIEAGKNTFGLDQLTVEDITSFARNHPGASFDLVTFFDVLEHVDNHREFIATIRGLLAPGGYVAMSMPYRGRAPWLMEADVPPRHLTRWDRGSLKGFLEREGFETLYIHRTPASIRFIILKLRFRFGRKLSVGLVKKVRNAEGGTNPARSRALLIAAQAAAQIKDAILFGLPALVIWLTLLPTKKRYIGLYAIARKKV